MPHISPLWWVSLIIWFLVIISITFIILNWSSSTRANLSNPSFNSSRSDWEWN